MTGAPDPLEPGTPVEVLTGAWAGRTGRTVVSDVLPAATAASLSLVAVELVAAGHDESRTVALRRAAVRRIPQRIEVPPGHRPPEGSVLVDEPSKWANPFQVGAPIDRESPLFPYLDRVVPGGTAGMTSVTPLDPQAVVDAYGWWLIEQPGLMLSLSELAGKDLATATPADQPSHADFLLEMANLSRSD